MYNSAKTISVLRGNREENESKQKREKNKLDGEGGRDVAVIKCKDFDQLETIDKPNKWIHSLIAGQFLI